MEMSDLKVPVLSIVIGEGGSVVHLPSVLEMKSDAGKCHLFDFIAGRICLYLMERQQKSKRSCEIMKITAKDLKALGIIEQVIEEPYPACEENLEEISENMKTKMREFLQRMDKKTKEELAEDRYERFRKM